MRFPEFTDEWRSKKLGDLSDVTKLAGFEFTKYVNYSDNGNIIALRGVNIKKNKLDLTDVKYIDNSDFNKLNRSKLYPGDLLFTYVGTIGNVALIFKKNKYYLAPNVCRIRSESFINSQFLKFYFNTQLIKKEINRYVTKSSQPALSMENIRKFNVNIPNIKEQNKIANFISLIDRKIDLLEKTLCLHQKFIEGLKESIFSNLNYPKFKLNNFMKISKIKCNDNINKRLTVKLNLKGIVPRETKTTEKEGVTTQYIRKKGQFIYGKQNLYKGAFGIIPKELDGYMSSSDIPSFDFINNKLNPYWFYYFISRKNYYSRLEKYSTGTGSKRISPEEFLNIKIPLTPIEKQNNQVKMFNKLIERQNILIKEKEYLYNFKKGLLQKMFV